MLHLYHRGMIQRASIKLGQALLILALLLSLGGNASAAGAASYQQIFLSLPANAFGNTTTLYLHNSSVSSAVNLALSFSNGQTFPDTIPAGATLVKNLSTMGLPSGSAGILNLFLSSDQPVEALAEIRSASGERLAIIAGQTPAGTGTSMIGSSPASHLFFGPLPANLL